MSASCWARLALRSELLQGVYRISGARVLRGFDHLFPREPMENASFSRQEGSVAVKGPVPQRWRFGVQKP